MEPTHPTRRLVIRRVAMASAAIGVAGLAAPALADSIKVSKADVKYQFTPQGENRCGVCFYFVPGSSSGAPGTCKAVDGPIPQNGWCVLFAHKK